MAALGPLERLLLLVLAAVGLFKLVPVYVACCCVAAAFVALYVSIKHEHGYWQRMGIAGPGAEQSFPLAMFIQTNKHMLATDNEGTDTYGKLFGYHAITERWLTVSEPELLKRIIVKDFNHFVNRLSFQLNQYSLLGKMLSVQRDDRWKSLRNTVTPAFTSGKMKHMPYYISQSLQRLDQVLGEAIGDAKPVKMKDTMSRYTLDVVASISFALDIEAQTRLDNPFVEHARKIINVDFAAVGLLLTMSAPNLVEQFTKLTGVSLVSHQSEQFFRRSVRQIIENRRDHPLSRPDFLQLCLNSQKMAQGLEKDVGDVDADIAFEQTKSAQKAVMTEDELIAQSVLFLVAGFDTTATTLEFCFYELARHPDVQQRCREEVLDKCGSDPSKYTYDQVMHLDYADAVISETLRMYPVAFRTMRYCNKPIDYPDYNLHITAGTVIIIPIYHMHHDADNFPEPEQFRPERFVGSAKESHDPFVYMPFGGGPRNCIGMRFAQLELRQTIAHVLAKYTVKPCQDTPPKLEFVQSSLLRAKNEIPLLFEPL